MPAQNRNKTKYPGVHYIQGKPAKGSGTERIYYIMYRQNGKLIEEKVGRQLVDDMTPAKAAGIRAQRIEGKELSNKQKREEARRTKSRWTIEKLWDEYRSQLSGGDASETDKGRWKNYLQGKFGNKEPSELFKLDIDRIRINLLKKLAPQTVKHILSLLRRIINFGIDRGLVSPLPFKIAMPSVDNIKTEDLTPNQIQNLFKVLEVTPHHAAANMMKLALFTGMRRGEMFKLKWDDLDFHREFIFIHAPKGGKSQKIPMSKSAKEVLQSIQVTNSEYIFPARNGGPRKDISKALKSIKEEAGLPTDFRPLHGLRHVFATMLASSGEVDMFTLQKLLTHKSPEMTQRYAHFRDEAMQRAANKVDNILSDALEDIGTEHNNFNHLGIAG